ncbi:ATP-dependent endonuclease [Desulfovibrio sp. OttesenSCG-928-I05]|nr:ATP-dependent endonuclease [Desulfovibrio sp. OttesenSCG-928-I05]
MQVSKIEVDNFRLLNKFTLTPECYLSLIIGKNNTAKTSLLTVLDKFINYQDAKGFTFNDLNIKAQKELKSYIASSLPEESSYTPIKISLRVYIEYSENDDIGRLSRLFVDLDPENNTVVLSYEYILDYEHLIEMRNDFLDSMKKLNEEGETELSEDSAADKFLGLGIRKYFHIEIKSMQFDKQNASFIEDSYVNIQSSNSIKDIISFHHISARRDVSNKYNNSTLSQQVVDIFNANEDNDAMREAFKDLRVTLVQSDHEIGKVYSTIFSDIADVVKKFGGMTPGDTQIQVMSNLRPDELLKNNATIVYQHEGQNLPEHYNGLGYMNLFSILFNLDSVLNRIRRSKSEIPADVNLLFIEEPEAHTHPQMQYIFIKNIKQLMSEKLRREDGIKANLQCLISTHSAHIVTNCDFDDIKYLKRLPCGLAVEAKNIHELQELYERDGEAGKAAYRFLKQYLTVNCSELFFTEKAIFVEGDSERIMLPTMMKKLDKKYPSEPPLLSQNISIVDGAGSHSKIFANFIEFIGLKSLIITDIDTYYDEPKNADDAKHIACPSSDTQALYTWNSSLRFFHCRGDDKACQYFLALGDSEKTIGYDPTTNAWKPMAGGNVFTAYQYGPKGAYAGCSFEDSFIEENKAFILEHGDKFESLRPKWLTLFKQTNDSFSLAQKGIKKKSSFALDLLLYEPEILNEDDNTPQNVWSVPLYIEEGLEWLRKL